MHAVNRERVKPASGAIVAAAGAAVEIDRSHGDRHAHREVPDAVLALGSDIGNIPELPLTQSVSAAPDTYQSAGAGEVVQVLAPFDPPEVFAAPGSQ